LRIGRQLPDLPPGPWLQQPEAAHLGARRPALPLLPFEDGRPADRGRTAAVLPRPDTPPLSQLHDLSRRDPRLEPLRGVPQLAMRIAGIAAALVLGVAPALQAQTTVGQDVPVEFELGYRFVKVSGNDDMYRTQINDRPGVLLRSLTWAFTKPL